MNGDTQDKHFTGLNSWRQQNPLIADCQAAEWHAHTETHFPFCHSHYANEKITHHDYHTKWAEGAIR